MNNFTYGSLFSGIGGIDLGLDRAGMQCAWQVEIDPYAKKVLAKHWPDVARYGDIRTVGKRNLTKVDLICGGFPCQDISQANQIDAQGFDGERTGLWAEFYRVICELRPRYILVENVSALLVRGLGRVLGDLAGIRYDAEWQVLRACDFGLPHRRKRVFIVAYPASQRRVRIFEGQVTSHQSDFVYQGKQRHTQVSKVVALRHVLSQAESLLSQPSVCGMDDGIPDWVDSALRGLGNAVVSQVAEYVGRCILAAAESEVPSASK